MPAEPLHPIADPLPREDVLLLQRLATEAQPPDEICLYWCRRALEGDVEALSYLREQLVAAREAEVEDRREEIWKANRSPDVLWDEIPMGALPLVEADEGETVYLLELDGTVAVRTGARRHFGVWLEAGDEEGRIAKLRAAGAATLVCMTQRGRQAWFGRT